ncbi:MAG: thioredoxin family protein [Clostridia bacterium]|nr:thioredoxin family protein [Clostridia bacterium]HQO69907.1 uroporphyrinogen decarboxylase family protein [Clostridia bacterium]
MNNKQLVLDAIMNKQTERAPWVPFVGCHAASLLENVTAEMFFKDSDLIVEGVKKAVDLYRPDGIPVLFDLQLEAEALGCKLRYAKDNPPSVVTHPLEDGVKLEQLKIPTVNDGRFKLVMESAKRLCEELGNDIAMYGLITGPYTLALHLMGTEIFYEMIDDPDHVMEVLDFCKDVCIACADMYIDAGCDIIAVVDPMTSQISPDSFEEFVLPYAVEIFNHIRTRNRLSSLFVCGDAKKNIEVMSRCKCDNISIDENIPLEYVIDICKKSGVSVGGNIKLTVTMLFGTVQDNINDALNCMSIGGTKGYILSPGCDMPYATPVENVLAIAAVAHGEMPESIVSESALDGIVIELPDYKAEKKVIIDVITLDSASCAPCQYMMEAVKAACEGLSDKVAYLEHKIKDKESVVFMMKLGVSNIPTIVIDGQIKYISLVPSVKELRETILKAVELKK